MTFYIEWAALRLAGIENLRGVLYENSAKGDVVSPGLLDAITRQSIDQLRAGLQKLVDASLTVDETPLLFFPKTALAYALNPPENRMFRAQIAWDGDGFHSIGERDYAPGYSALMGRGLDFFDEKSAAHESFVAATTLVCDVLDPERATLLKMQDSAPATAEGTE